MSGAVAGGELWCVTMANWQAEELGARHIWPIDLPDTTPPGTTVWVPGQLAAAWQARGNAPTFRSWGSTWPQHIPPWLLGNAWQVTLGPPPPYKGVRHTKLADAKDPRFPAQPRTHQQLLRDLVALGGDTEVMVCPVRDYRTEVRVFYSTAGATWCTYQHGGAYYDGEVPLPAPPEFVPPPLPPGLVVDYGCVAGTGVWEVVEYNAAWSSAWYGCDTGLVAQAIRDSYSAPHLPRWEPDEVYQRYAAAAAPALRHP